MDSEPTTNRKRFLKRATLAIAGVFTVSSIASNSSRGDRKQTASLGDSSTSSSSAGSAMARVRTAKGAVPRKA